jgi:hypothetical protein
MLFSEGDERDHGIAPISSWFKFLRVRRCQNNLCAYFRPESDQSVSIENRDTDYRFIDSIYECRFEDVLGLFSGSFVSDKMDSVCIGCREKTVSQFIFPDEAPSFFAYPLLCGNETFTTEDELPVSQTVCGREYLLYAYSLYDRNCLPSH